MKKTIFIESLNLQNMKAAPSVSENLEELRSIKYDLEDGIESAYGDRWWLLKKENRALFEEICFLSRERGFFWAGPEWLAEKCKISERSVRRYLKELCDFGILVRLHQRSRRCNGRGKPIYLFKSHPLFPQWVEFLGLDLSEIGHAAVHTETAGSACPSKPIGIKKITTYLTTEKQEKDNIGAIEKMRKYADLKIADIIQKGVSVKYISSYLGKIFKSMETRAMADAAFEDSARRRRAREESHRAYLAATGSVSTPLPFYNWLES